MTLTIIIVATVWISLAILIYPIFIVSGRCSRAEEEAEIQRFRDALRETPDSGDSFTGRAA